MRAYQVFAGMPPEQATEVLRGIRECSPETFAGAVQAASAVMKMRPVAMRKQPLERQAQAVRRTAARVLANALAEELLAVYFLEWKKPLLLEWLEAIGLEHEDGMLASDAPAPPSEVRLSRAVESFRRGDDRANRELLLRAFAAQTAIDWPNLDALLEARPERDDG